MSGVCSPGRKLLSMISRLLIVTVVVAVVSGSAAWAADAVFPPGSRIGLVPPPGVVTSKSFPGFEDKAHGVAIFMNEVPVESAGEAERAFSAEGLKAQGLGFEKREDTKSKDWRGALVVARQELSGVPVHKWIMSAIGSDAAAIIGMQVPDAAQTLYPEAAIRAALMSTVFRPAPVAERLAMLPYAMANLAGFRLLQASAEGTALLTDGPKDVLTGMDQPFVLVTMTLSPPPQPSNYDAFARQVVASVPGIKGIRVVSAQALTLGAQPGYEVVAEGQNEKNGNDVTLVQWLRFGSTGFLRIIGIAPRSGWAAVFPRLRNVRDGIGPK